MDKRYKTLESLKQLRAMREKRAQEEVLQGRASVARATARISDLEQKIITEREAAHRRETESFEAVVGQSMSIADLSRLQSSASAEHKRAAAFGADLDKAVVDERAAEKRLHSSQQVHRDNLKAYRKIEAASKEAYRKLGRRQHALDELRDEDDQPPGRGFR